jgi:hypothetical protein
MALDTATLARVIATVIVVITSPRTLPKQWREHRSRYRMRQITGSTTNRTDQEGNMLLTDNAAVRKLITAQRRFDGQISEGVYIAMQYNCDTNELVRLWVGHRSIGPMLQYEEGEGWTPIYTHGNFGRNYACGGTWSSHCRNLISSREIGHPARGDQSTELLCVGKDQIESLPEGLKGDITQTSIDCSGGWVVWAKTARDAIDDILTFAEIQASTLPTKAKKHFCEPVVYNQAQKAIAEVIDVFNL